MYGVAAVLVAVGAGVGATLGGAVARACRRMAQLRLLRASLQFRAPPAARRCHLPRAGELAQTLFTLFVLTPPRQRATPPCAP
jgi:hypothetical protein